MATIATPKPVDLLVPVEEYLCTSYRPDCDYVDGRIEERNVGEFDHAILQRYLIFLFMTNRDMWGVDVLPELRTQVSPSRFRVPDVLVIRSGQRAGRILDRPPLIAIEILSPEDRMVRMQERIDDYVTFGVENIWILDPQTRSAWTANAAGLQRAQGGELAVAGTPIRIDLNELFAELDRA